MARSERIHGYKCRLTLMLVLMCLPTVSVMAEDGPGPSTSQPSNESTAAAPTTQPAAPAFFRLDYGGDLLHSPGLTGDWGGARTKLAEEGISFNVEVLQFMQGNAHGGKDTNHAISYSGSSDYILQLDTGRMGLWPGGYFKVRGETEFGRGVGREVGAVSPPNFDALLPVPDDCGLTTLTEAWYMQYLSEKLYVLGGKVDPTRLPGGNAFSGDAYSQFMNTSLWQNPVTFSTVPYTSMTAGVGYIPTKWFDGATLVLDSYGTPTESGFDTAFHSPNGATFLQVMNFHVKPFDLPGTQRLNFSYSTRERYALDDLTRLALAGKVAPSFDRLNLGGLSPSRQGGFSARQILRRALLSRLIEPSQQSGNWAFWYDFDQYLYTEPQDPTQGWGLFGRFGWAPEEFNPAQTFYSLGIGGKGVIPTRDQDRFGIGYYAINFSDDLPRVLGANIEQGVEMFYNIEVTPWLHITPDLQVIIDPGGSSDNDPAIVYGLRAQMSL